MASGVVSKVEWTNPHMRVYIDVTDKAGKVTTYNMEMTSPNTIRRRGWTMNTLLPGEKVVFEGYLGRVVESRGALAENRQGCDAGSGALQPGRSGRRRARLPHCQSWRQSIATAR